MKSRLFPDPPQQSRDVADAQMAADALSVYRREYVAQLTVTRMLPAASIEVARLLCQALASVTTADGSPLPPVVAMTKTIGVAVAAMLTPPVPPVEALIEGVTADDRPAPSPTNVDPVVLWWASALRDTVGGPDDLLGVVKGVLTILSGRVGVQASEEWLAERDKVADRADAAWKALVEGLQRELPRVQLVSEFPAGHRRKVNGRH